MSNLLGIFLIFLGVASAAFAFECHQCDSVNTPECVDLADPYVPSYVNCAEGYCYKLVFEVTSLDYKKVERGCTNTYDDIPEACKISTKATIELPPGVGCYLCESDRCNSVANLKSYVVLAFAAAYLLYLL